MCLIFREPKVAEMSAMRIESHLIAQDLLERFDRFSLRQDIVDIVHNVHSGIAAQSIEDASQGAVLNEGIQIRPRIAYLLLPQR